MQQQLEMMTQTRAHESTYAGQQIQQLARQVEVNFAINKEIMACDDVQDLCSVIQNRVAEFNYVNVRVVLVFSSTNY